MHIPEEYREDMKAGEELCNAIDALLNKHSTSYGAAITALALVLARNIAEGAADAKGLDGAIGVITRSIADQARGRWAATHDDEKAAVH